MTDDLRDALDATYDKLAGDTPDAGQASETARTEPESGEGVESAETTRARDEQGRFAAAEKVAAADGKDKPRETLSLKKGAKDAPKEPERAAQAAADKPGAGDADKQGAGIQEPAANLSQQPGANRTGDQASVPPPAHWLGDAKKHWDRLPAEVRKSIAADGQSAQQAQALTQAIGPAADVLTREFGGVDRGIAAVLKTWQYARTNHLDFAREYLQFHNIDPRALIGEAPSPQSQQTEADPVLAPVLERLNRFEAALQQVSQQPLIAQQNQIQTEVQAFGNAVSQDGKVAHPYFNDVKPVMAALMSSGQAQTLSDAYDMAVNAHPQIRASIRAADEAKQADARRRAAETAKAAGVSIAGAPGNRGPGQASNETVDQTLERAWERAQSGGRA